GMGAGRPRARARRDDAGREAADDPARQLRPLRAAADLTADTTRAGRQARPGRPARPAADDLRPRARADQARASRRQEPRRDRERTERRPHPHRPRRPPLVPGNRPLHAQPNKLTLPSQPDTPSPGMTTVTRSSARPRPALTSPQPLSHYPQNATGGLAHAAFSLRVGKTYLRRRSSNVTACSATSSP